MKSLILIIALLCIAYLTYAKEHKNNKLIFGLVILLLSLCVLFINYQIVNKFSTQFLILIIILAIITGYLIWKSGQIEGLTSDEAIKNVASVYNSDKMVVKDLTVTGALTVNNNASIGGTVITPAIKTDKLSKNKQSLITFDSDINSKNRITGNLIHRRAGRLITITGNTSQENNVHVYANNDDGNPKTWKQQIGSFTSSTWDTTK
jgi:hypothetical protein